jgi:hypothetical protein
VTLGCEDIPCADCYHSDIIQCTGRLIITIQQISDIFKKSEDTTGLIRIRKSKMDRHYNGQKKKDKRTNNDLHIHIKLKIE